MMLLSSLVKMPAAPVMAAQARIQCEASAAWERNGFCLRRNDGVPLPASSTKLTAEPRACHQGFRYDQCCSSSSMIRTAPEGTTRASGITVSFLFAAASVWAREMPQALITTSG